MYLFEVMSYVMYARNSHAGRHMGIGPIGK